MTQQIIRIPISSIILDEDIYPRKNIDLRRVGIYIDSAYDYYGNPGGLKQNPLAIACALKSAWEDGLKSASLVKLVEDIVVFARKEGS